MKLRLSEAQEWGWDRLSKEWLLNVQATRKRSTHESYSERNRLFLRWLAEQQPSISLDDFGVSHVDAYLVYRADQGAGPVTRSYDAKLIRMMLDFGYTREILPRRILRDYKIKSIPTKEEYCPTIDEMQRFLDAVHWRWDPAKNERIKNVNKKERAFLRARDMAIFTGLLDMACRPDELLAIELQDLDVERMQIIFNETKTGVPRTVPFTEKWLEMVQAWRRVRPKCEATELFISTFGDTLTVNQLSATFRVYRDLAGLTKQIHLYSLRHYAITALAETDVLAAKEIAGHKRLETTLGYTHTREARVFAMHAQADPLGKVLVNKRSEAQAKAARRKLI